MSFLGLILLAEDHPLAAFGLVLINTLLILVSTAFVKSSRRYSSQEMESWLSVLGDLRMTCDTDMNIVSVGKGFRAFTGRDPNDKLGKPFLSFIHPDDHAATSDFILEMARNTIPYQSHSVTVRWKHAKYSTEQKTRWLWMEWNGTVAPELDRVFLNATNITPHIERSASVGVWARITSDLLAVSDIDVPFLHRKFEWLNEAWTRHLGWSLDDLYAMSLPELLDPCDLREIARLRQETEHSGQEESVYRCKVKCKPGYSDKEYLNFEWRSLTFNGKNYVTGRPIEHELEHLAQMQEMIFDLQSSNRDLEQFTSVAAHQLRSPPRTIAGCAIALQEDFSDALPQDALDLLTDIRSDADHMAEVVDGLYRFSKIRTLDSMPAGPIDLNLLMDSVLTQKRKQTHTDGVEAPFTVEWDHLPTVSGDATLLEEVLSNLVANGLKFNESELKTVRVTARALPDSVWEISVTDNGIGIPAKYMGKLFKMFERIQPQYPGTGVGLALVHAIITKMGGQLRVESEEGVGSTFTFTVKGVS